ncbi:R3H domain-containing protein 2 [Trichinella nelsoni]|uniref:R3H domain-containing protein 2 n=1 Tax=Trichinella nelsoni TaxID=6336 RepID=A0A0V0S9B6_9BILA|nr:R3H domain-containing protein 2 [Trichinella nelsoni]
MEIRSDHGLRAGAVLTVCKQWIAMSGTHPKGGKGSSKRPPFRLAKQTEVDDDSAATTPTRTSQQQSAGGTSTAAKQQQQQQQPPPPPSEEPPAERRSSSDGSRPPTTPTTKAQISCGRVQSKNNSPKNSKPLPRVNEREALRTGGCLTTAPVPCFQTIAPDWSTSPDMSGRLSFEYREFHGADPEKFFKETMRKNVRDRNILFEFESELINFIQNENCQVKEFPGMCSYYRMLLHRVSAYFGLEHNVIAGGTSLAVKKTPNTRIPPVSFQSLYNECMEKPTSTLATTTTTLATTTITTSVATAITTSTTNVPVLLKREAEVGKENGSNTEIPKPEMKATKSIEEREQSYVLARARIFSKTSSSSTDAAAETARRFCAKPWSSAENNPETCIIYNQQKCLAQQYGFGNNGGGGGTGRNLSIPPVEAAPPYAHPSYRLNEIMEMPNVPQFGRMFNPLSVFPGSPVMCLVQSIDQVPEGALLINPHTGEPLLNTDGSLCFHNSRTMLRMQQQMNTFAATSNVHPHATMGSISPGDQMTAAATMLPNNLQSLNINVDHPPTMNTYTNEPPMAAQFNAGMNQSVVGCNFAGVQSQMPCVVPPKPMMYGAQTGPVNGSADISQMGMANNPSYSFYYPPMYYSNYAPHHQAVPMTAFNPPTTVMDEQQQQLLQQQQQQQQQQLQFQLQQQQQQQQQQQISTAAESANNNEELMLNRYGDAETPYAAQVMHPMNNFQGNVFDQYRRGSQDDRQNE